MGTSRKPASDLSANIDIQLPLGPFIEHLRLGILILDEASGKISEANSAALTLLGYSRPEVIGKPIWEMRPFLTIIPSESNFKDILDQVAYENKKLSFLTKNGTQRKMELLIDLFQESDINVLICQLNGITEEIRTKETEQSLLEKQIREQSAELDRLYKQIEDDKDERQRWTQHLHDTISQSLFSAGLIAEVLPRLWERDQAAAHRSLEDLRRLTFGAMAEMRVLLAESRPAILAEAELADLIMILGNVAAGRLNVPVSVEAKNKSTLPPDVRIALYHLCKEVLAIITQRAKAHKIIIKTVEDPSKAEIHINMEGDKFDIRTAAPMQQKEFQQALLQAESCGARLEIEPPKDGSVEVVIQWKRRVS